MIIDLHIHSRSCSDGNLTVEEIVGEAKKRNIDLMSITDHDSINCQERAMALAKKSGIGYVSGVEIGVTFSHPRFLEGKSVALDLLGYDFDVRNKELKGKLQLMARRREERAAGILVNINVEFAKSGIVELTEDDFREIQALADGTLGRPHIAAYLVNKGIVKTQQEAFDKYLVKCDVPKYSVPIEEASALVRNAGGVTVLAHPNDPHGISLAKLTRSLQEQTRIVEESMLGYLDGIECWHSRSDGQTTGHYVAFAKKHNLVTTGGSDCHQKPIIMGEVNVPLYVAEQFRSRAKE